MRRYLLMQFMLFLMPCCVNLAYGSSWVFNNPYPESEANENIYYSSFNEQPKTLDPARSYSSNEYLFIAQIYEPLLEYDYYKRPYELIPLTATRLPQIRYLDAQGNPVSAGDNTKPAYSVYTIQIKKGILYQPHPALAQKKDGSYRYHHLPEDYLEEHDISKLSDFKYTGTRELIIDDYIYQIKRLANPAVSSPIYGLMSYYILGFKEYGDSLPKGLANKNSFIDLRKYPLKGVKKLDDYTFEITLKGQYTQFLFWLAMPFFAPVPWEADLFYSQKDMDDKNLSFGWYPIGTGPFMLTENNPNRSMILEKNPNFREVYFPVNGSDADRRAGYLTNQGRRLPLIDKAVYTLEKESIPRWNKFLQGYYDMSGISADSFDQAIHINRFGEPILSQEMKDKKIYLRQTLEPSIYYTGFNMLDSVVGGNSKRARKLRQAISIAVNFDENIAIFFNGRGIPAQGPIPPGIFGYKEGKEGINPYVYQWVNNARKRKSLKDAQKLMVEAGYPGGIDPKTGKHLILHYDVMTTGGPDDKARLDWMRKQFANIGIDLNIRATLYNRFQEKMRIGHAQIFSWGWNADYPDPENFLFLLYGKNGKVKYGGENASNYENPEFDRLFNLMKNRPNDLQRQKLIDKMLAIVRYDAPWVWGMHSEDFILSQDWVSNIKSNTISLNTLKYVSVNVPERNQLRRSWNQPVFWPLGVLFGLLVALVIPLLITYLKKEKQPAERVKLK
ncbi:TPA: peptide ABC transporter substrate-binding protein [Legionella pneumophila]|nr:peptide ABC transporter substrate-binding protein [Legionella pneumophila]HAT8919099.1 peptide ABC transporter substrate-binding protein [Legionella pneumophila subsp. pneumophila]TIG59441.1 peptide ABC transporter substrate-binding protein [Legionella pneumophila]TIG69198.1 peptide ABC transporter substrate-binding protein [Legionella pneumophila]TIG72583.1 peptide ABC transporter substrate-binding protein [Legionella pneumophila]